MTKNNFPAVLLWGGGICFIKKICYFVTETIDKITEMCYNIDDDKTSSREPAREPEKESEEKIMHNVRIHDNGSGFCIDVNGLTVCVFRTLGDAWRHIVWMYEVASQKFTVGKREIPVTEWIENMKDCGALD